MAKEAMTKGSGALHLLLVSRRQLGFTSNATEHEPESFQTDAEMHHDDLAFEPLERRQLQNAPSAAGQPGGSSDATLSSDEFLVPAKKINILHG